MKYKSTKLGYIEYSKESILSFEEGLFGFEGLKEYVLVSDKEGIFQYLQSLEDADITFVVCNPTDVVSDYELIIDKNDIESLNLKSKKDIASLVIVTIPTDVKKVTVNFLGPIVINVSNKKAKQVVSKSENHTTKHSLLEEEEEGGKNYIKRKNIV